MNSFQMDEHWRVADTPSLRKILLRVNREVNRLPYKTDWEKFGKQDYWTDQIDKLQAGDCDDYALTKRRILMEQGVPWQCLSPAICKMAGEGHAVLLFRTDKTNLVLDNNFSNLEPWDSLNLKAKKYTWISWFHPVRKKWFTFT